MTSDVDSSAFRAGRQRAMALKDELKDKNQYYFFYQLSPEHLLPGTIKRSNRHYCQDYMIQKILWNGLSIA